MRIADEGDGVTSTFADDFVTNETDCLFEGLRRTILLQLMKSIFSDDSDPIVGEDL
jgi:hypothetical protein